MGDFQPISRCISGTIQDRDIASCYKRLIQSRTRSVEWYHFPVTLIEPNYPKLSYFSNIASTFLSLEPIIPMDDKPVAKGKNVVTFITL